MRRLAVLGLVLFVSACTASRTGGSGDAALLDLWTAFSTAGPGDDWDEGGNDVSCPDEFGTYFAGFGARGLACMAAGQVDLAGAVARAGVSVFRTGPHQTSGGAFALDLSGESNDFGHYNPAFVDWAIDAAVIGESDGAMRSLAIEVYDSHLQRLARVFWLVLQDLEADGFPGTTPAGVASDYVRYLQTGTLGAGGSEYYPGYSMTVFNDQSRAIPSRLGIAADDLDFYSAQYEANTAYGFWLRRRADGTHAQFRDGLAQVLGAYDAAWLRSQR